MRGVMGVVVVVLVLVDSEPTTAWAAGPPVIVARRPDSVVVNATSGRPMTFSITARDPGGGRLKYVWQHNGRIAIEGNTSTLVLSGVDDGDDVEVTVVNEQGDRTSWVWRIAGRSVPAPPKPSVPPVQ